MSDRQNPPGLPALAYTGGEYIAALRRMLARLAHQGELARLNPEAVDDWSIALLHVSAVVTDVLTFYQERITNEGYLGTASDPRSILELARAIGYELKPGVAASAYLAVTVPPDDNGQPREATVKSKAAIQSTPAEGELPQIFETQAEVRVRTEWNTLVPLVNLAAAARTGNEPEDPLPIYLTSLRIAGYRTDIHAGDLILIVDGAPQAAPPGSEQATPAESYLLATVKNVDANPAKPYTVLTWEYGQSEGELFHQPLLYVFRQKVKLYEYAAGSVYFSPEPPAAPAEEGAPEKDKIAAWSPRTLGLPRSDINTLVSNKKEMLFAGTKSDLFRSPDYGVSWQRVPVDLMTRAVTALAVSEDGMLFAGTSTGGIYVSRDDGDNWTPMSGDSVAPDATVDQSGTKYTVSYSQILPKAPVRDLDTYKDGSSLLVYAATDKGIFRSSDEGKTWQGPLTINADGSLLVSKAAPPATPPAAPPATPPATPQQTEPAAAALPAAAAVTPIVAAGTTVSAGQRFLALLGNIGPALTKVAAALKSFGIDISALLLPWIGASVSQVPVRSLAVNPKGKQPTVLVGTDAGKFKLKGDTNRWLLAGVILLVAMLMQFLSSRGAVGPFPLVVEGASGTITLPPSLVAAATPLPDAHLSILGTLQLNSALPITDTAYTFTLVEKGDFSVSASQTVITATGSISGKSTLTPEANDGQPPESADVYGQMVLTAAVSASTTVTTTDTPVVMPGTITITGSLMHSAEQPLQLQVSNATFSSEFAAPPAPIFPWLNNVVMRTWEWLRNLIVTAQDAVQSFFVALWDLVPDSVKSVLQPVYDFVYGKLIQPVLVAVNTYLVQPLLANTAGMLAKLAYAAAGVWLALAVWRYLAGRVANSKGVRIDGTINDLIILPSGQIFAASSKGLYRSLEDQPSAPLPERIRRLALRTLLKDRPMELLTAPANDYRTLIALGGDMLMAGTADGQVWRASKNGDHWYPYNQDTQDVQDPAAADGAGRKALRGLKSVRVIVAVPQGQFILGDPVDKPVLDQWYTAQLADGVQIDLKAANPLPSAGGWVVLSEDSAPASGSPAESGTAARVRTYYGRFTLTSAETAPTREFGQLGAFPRLLVSQAGTKPVNVATLARSTADVWIDSARIDLYDNRPIAGKNITFDRYIPGIEPGHLLVLCGKPLRVQVFAERNSLYLQPDDRQESYSLEPGEGLGLLAAPDAAAAGAGQFRWRLRRTDGTVGTVTATKQQLRWQAPLDSDPYQCELVTVATVGAGINGSPDQAATGAATDLKTIVSFNRGLAYCYDRATVSLAGNIVPVTHGRTVENFIIGNGNGMAPNERFSLPEQPLTYLSTDRGYGAEPQLAVAVNEVEWERVPVLYGLARDRRGYIVRQESDGTTSIIFGDGIQGARLPTGTDQVTATYRVGNGKKGNVLANAINQPQTFPASVRTATNPLPAAGGAEPEDPASARRLAPRNTRCLGRIVALLDYEDFAQMQTGIARAQVAEFEIAGKRVVFLTIAGQDGDPQAVDQKRIHQLGDAIDRNRAVRQPRVVIEAYDRLLFNVSAKVLIANDSIGLVKEIERQARKRLLDAFAFAQRQFGQKVTEAEIVAEIARVPHVEALRAVQLYLARDSRPPADDLSPRYKVLVARPARQDPPDTGQLNPAELLLINPLLEGIQLSIAAIDAPDTVLNAPKETA